MILKLLFNCVTRYAVECILQIHLRDDLSAVVGEPSSMNDFLSAATGQTFFIFIAKDYAKQAALCSLRSKHLSESARLRLRQTSQLRKQRSLLRCVLT